MADEKKYIVHVDLTDGNQEDIQLGDQSKKGAASTVDEIFEQGFIKVVRQESPYREHIYPLHKIREISIREVDRAFVPPPNPVKK